MRALAGSTRVYPCLRTLSMGFSWAMYFCHCATESLVAEAVAGGLARAAREKHVTPDLSATMPITSSYVDNVAVFSLGKSFDAFKAVERKFEQAGLLVHEVETGQAALRHLGAVVDGVGRRITHQPERIWKVYLAGREMLRRHRLRGEVLRIWVGHVVNIMMLTRPASTTS